MVNLRQREDFFEFLRFANIGVMDRMGGLTMDGAVIWSCRFEDLEKRLWQKGMDLIRNKDGNLEITIMECFAAVVTVKIALQTAAAPSRRIRYPVPIFCLLDNTGAQNAFRRKSCTPVLLILVSLLCVLFLVSFRSFFLFLLAFLLRSRFWVVF